MLSFSHDLFCKEYKLNTNRINHGHWLFEGCARLVSSCVECQIPSTKIVLGHNSLTSTLEMTNV